jgi:hypothetical protein
MGDVAAPARQSLRDVVRHHDERQRHAIHIEPLVIELHVASSGTGTGTGTGTKSQTSDGHRPT